VVVGGRDGEGGSWSGARAARAKTHFQRAHPLSAGNRENLGEDRAAPGRPARG